MKTEHNFIVTYESILGKWRLDGELEGELFRSIGGTIFEMDTEPPKRYWAGELFDTNEEVYEREELAMAKLQYALDILNGADA